MPFTSAKKNARRASICKHHFEAKKTTNKQTPKVSKVHATQNSVRKGEFLFYKCWFSEWLNPMWASLGNDSNLAAPWYRDKNAANEYNSVMFCCFLENISFQGKHAHFDLFWLVRGEAMLSFFTRAFGLITNQLAHLFVKLFCPNRQLEVCTGLLFFFSSFFTIHLLWAKHFCKTNKTASGIQQDHVTSTALQQLRWPLSPAGPLLSFGYFWILSSLLLLANLRLFHTQHLKLHQFWLMDRWSVWAPVSIFVTAIQIAALLCMMQEHTHSAGDRFCHRKEIGWVPACLFDSPPPNSLFASLKFQLKPAEDSPHWENLCSNFFCVCSAKKVFYWCIPVNTSAEIWHRDNLIDMVNEPSCLYNINISPYLRLSSINPPQVSLSQLIRSHHGWVADMIEPCMSARRSMRAAIICRNELQAREGAGVPSPNPGTPKCARSGWHVQFSSIWWKFLLDEDSFSFCQEFAGGFMQWKTTQRE